MAKRDAILAYAAELLDLDAYQDFGPMGMQVEGAEEVSKIACGVSASLALFQRAVEQGAQLLVVHHVAAGHYATERLGVQALAKKLAEHFKIEADYIELGNPV